MVRNNTCKGYGFSVGVGITAFTATIDDGTGYAIVYYKANSVITGQHNGETT